MNNLDTDTLETVFERHLQDGEKDAALTVAQMAFGSLKGTPRDWLEDNHPNLNTSKIRVIKELRAEFDLDLKDAKAVVDEYEADLEPDFVEPDDILDVARVGLDVKCDGEDDEITNLDKADPSLQIKTANAGWIRPNSHDWKVPAEVV